MSLRRERTSTHYREGAPMSLLEGLRNPPPPKTPGFSAWLKTQDPETMAALIDAAKDTRWTHTNLHRYLRDNNVRVSKETMTSWRKDNGYPQ